MRTPFFSLYIKQREIERIWDRRVKDRWACGFASLVTCFRLLGDRSTEDAELVRQFRKSGGKPSHGMTPLDVVALARIFGYGAQHRSSMRSWETVDRWLNAQFKKRLPVMISVDPRRLQPINNFSDPCIGGALPLERGKLYRIR